MTTTNADRPEVVEDQHLDFLYDQSEDVRMKRRDLIKAVQSEFGLSKSDAKVIYDHWESLIQM